MMNKKILILGTIFIFFVFGLVFRFAGKGDDQAVISEASPGQEKIKIAACPTCYEMTNNLDKSKYQVIATASTAESVDMLRNRQVDMILSGRTLKPHEPGADFLIIKEGFSFLSDKTERINSNDLQKYNIYTDLDDELLKDELSLENIQKVDDVYKYLSEGIIITSWENTDYTKADIVHVMNSDGERIKLSRRPTLYCPDSCGEEARNLSMLLK